MRSLRRQAIESDIEVRDAFLRLFKRIIVDKQIYHIFNMDQGSIYYKKALLILLVVRKFLFKVRKVIEKV